MKQGISLLQRSVMVALNNSVRLNLCHGNIDWEFVKFSVVFIISFPFFFFFKPKEKVSGMHIFIYPFNIVHSLVRKTKDKFLKKKNKQINKSYFPFLFVQIEANKIHTKFKVITNVLMYNKLFSSMQSRIVFKVQPTLLRNMSFQSQLPKSVTPTCS